MKKLNNWNEFLNESKSESEFEIIGNNQDITMDDIMDAVNIIKKEFGNSSIKIIDKSGHKSGNKLSLFVDINLSKWENDEEGLVSIPLKPGEVIRKLNKIINNYNVKIYRVN